MAPRKCRLVEVDELALRIEPDRIPAGFARTDINYPVGVNITKACSARQGNRERASQAHASTRHTGHQT
jgi:hypothetical protein